MTDKVKEIAGQENCADCGEHIDEIGDALDALFIDAMFDDDVQEFARQHPDKELKFELIVRASVINSDCDVFVGYEGPTVNSSDPDVF